MELPQRRRLILTILSFVLPLALWSVVSYVPFIWHPLVMITDAGDVDYFSVGDEFPYADFLQQNQEMIAQHQKPAQGYRVNPVYLPPPHEVARALYTAFKTPPRLPGEPWLHQSLGHSISTIFWGVFPILGTRRSAGNFVRDLPIFFRGCRSRLSSFSGICRRRRSGRCAWRY